MVSKSLYQIIQFMNILMFLVHDEILKLYKVDIEYFGKLLIVLDGDVPDEKIKKHLLAIKYWITLLLCQVANVRRILYDYLIQLESHHPYWEKTEEQGLQWLYFKENGPTNMMVKKGINTKNGFRIMKDFLKAQTYLIIGQKTIKN